MPLELELNVNTSLGSTFIGRRAIGAEFQGFEGDGEARVAKVAVQVRRFWLPFLAWEMVSPWYWKPVAFVFMAWRFWVRRSL